MGAGDGGVKRATAVNFTPQNTAVSSLVNLQ